MREGGRERGRQEEERGESIAALTGGGERAIQRKIRGFPIDAFCGSLSLQSSIFVSHGDVEQLDKKALNGQQSNLRFLRPSLRAQ